MNNNRNGNNPMITCRAERERGKPRLGQLILSLGLSLCALTAQAAPTVSITNPVADSIIPAPASITVTADATDTAGTITKVDFYQGATLIGTATAAPYSATWSNAPAGTYPLTATATNDSNETDTSAPIQIIVNAPPTASLTSPTANQTYIAPASITLTANAADSDGTVAKVEYYQGAILIGTVNAAPYTATWQNAPAGTYTLTAKATDNNGATITSVAIPITVIPNQLPSITFTTPTAGQRFTAPATINLTASAQDIDGQINRVEYYQGTTLIGTATAAPYAATWQNVPEGQYSLAAKAIDNGGGETYASAVGITVDPAGRKIYYLHSDHLNTPRVVTDEQNRIVWRNAPLGEPFGTAAPEEDPDGDGVPFTLNLRFPGQYFDRETNLSYNYFRDYNSETGRYIESDPIGLEGGINTFAYVGGNPLGFTDPSGLCPWCAAASGGAGAGTLGAGGATTWWGGKKNSGGGAGADRGELFGDQAGSRGNASSSSNKKNSCDDCIPLYEAIDALVRQLQKRYYDIIQNKYNLPPTGPMSVAGHQQQFRNKQMQLQNLLSEADAKGCTGYRRDAWDWAYRLAPSPATP
jgi:RHS repeat-associated protein